MICKDILGGLTPPGQVLFRMCISIDFCSMYRFTVERQEQNGMNRIFESDIGALFPRNSVWGCRQDLGLIFEPNADPRWTPKSVPKMPSK